MLRLLLIKYSEKWVARFSIMFNFRLAAMRKITYYRKLTLFEVQIHCKLFYRLFLFLNLEGRCKIYIAVIHRCLSRVKHFSSMTVLLRAIARYA